MESEKQIVKIKKWTIELTEYSDGSSQIHRTNDGFHAYEILGLAVQAKEEIIKQMQGKMKPTVTKRTVIK